MGYGNNPISQILVKETEKGEMRVAQYNSTYSTLITPYKSYTKIHLGYLNFDDDSNFLKECKTEPDVLDRDYNEKPSVPESGFKMYYSPLHNQWRYFVTNPNLTLDERKALFQKVPGLSGNAIKLISVDSGSDNLPNTTPIIDFHDVIDWSWYPRYFNCEFDVQTPSHDSIIFQFGIFSYGSYSSVEDFNNNPSYGRLSTITIYYKNNKYYCAASRSNNDYTNNVFTTTQSVIGTISDTAETAGTWKHIICYNTSINNANNIIVVFDNEDILRINSPISWADYSNPGFNKNLSFVLDTHENINYEETKIYPDGTETVSNYNLSSAQNFPVMLWGSGNFINTFKRAKNVSKTKSNVTATIDVSDVSEDTYLTNNINYIKNPLPAGELTLSFDFNNGDSLTYDNLEVFKLEQLNNHQFDQDLFDIKIEIRKDIEEDILNPISIQVKEDFDKDLLNPIDISVGKDITPVDPFNISLDVISPFKPLEEVEEYINKTYLGSQQAADDFQLLYKVTDNSYWPVEFTIDNEYHIHIKHDPIYIGAALYACTNKQFLYGKYTVTN